LLRKSSNHHLDVFVFCANPLSHSSVRANAQDYLTQIDTLSDQNRRNVLRQITKLASGEGIRYESHAYGWPEGCYFLDGIKVGPADDILKLMDIGRECEEKWGKDHGNGWLLSHPLKKLYMFQQYYLQQD
jgi:hypothetical protein